MPEHRYWDSDKQKWIYPGDVDYEAFPPTEPNQIFPHATVIDEIAAERKRQIDVEGWTPEHDDVHDCGVLAKAAACYAEPSAAAYIWPWEQSWFKRSTRRRDLVKAAALIVAEIERIDRIPSLPR